MDTGYHRNNFHKHTYCLFREIAMPESFGKPHFISKSGSRYFFTEIGVYRISNHWGRAANCRWRLQPGMASTGREKTGFARWTDFNADNDHEKLYWLQFDPSTQNISYFHKNDAQFQGENLRTSAATVKRIRYLRSFIKSKAQLDHDSLCQIIEIAIHNEDPISQLLAQFHNSMETL